jgi:hypothetical protein
VLEVPEALKLHKCRWYTFLRSALAQQGADLHLDDGFGGNLVRHHGKMVASKRWVG